MDHTKQIITILAMTLDAYRIKYPETDVNDIMSALGWLLCDLATGHDVTREHFNDKLMETFDTVTLHGHDRLDD